MVSFTLLFKPSTTPDEIVPLARNQLRISASCDRSERATFFIGSIFDRIVRVVHCFRNRAGPVRAPYSQNRWKSSRSR